MGHLVEGPSLYSEIFLQVKFVQRKNEAEWFQIQPHDIQVVRSLILAFLAIKWDSIAITPLQDYFEIYMVWYRKRLKILGFCSPEFLRCYKRLIHFSIFLKNINSRGPASLFPSKASLHSTVCGVRLTCLDIFSLLLSILTFLLHVYPIVFILG